jgi:hypothetical protein
VTNETNAGTLVVGGTAEVGGPVAVGGSDPANNEGAALYSARGTSGLLGLAGPGPVGVVGDVASGTTAGAGLSGLCTTNGAVGCYGAVSWATVNNTADTGDATGLLALSSSIHAGGTNIGVQSTAALGSNNYSFYGTNGKIYNQDEIRTEKSVDIKEWVGGPTPLTDYGQLTTDTDNRLHFQDGDGNDHIIMDETRNAQYAEMYVYDNSTAQDVEAANAWIGAIGFTIGEYDSAHWSYSAGTTFIATSSANDGGSVQVTYNNHGLSNGDIVTLHGWPTLDGIYSIASVTTNNFTITAAWPGSDETDANSRVNNPSTWTALTGAEGIYFLNSGISITPGGNNHVFEFAAFENTTLQIDSVSRITSGGTGDYSVMRIGSLTLSVSVGDKIWLGGRNLSSATNCTVKHGNASLFKIN